MCANKTILAFWLKAKPPFPEAQDDKSDNVFFSGPCARLFTRSSLQCTDMLSKAELLLRQSRMR